MYEFAVEFVKASMLAVVVAGIFMLAIAYHGSEPVIVAGAPVHSLDEHRAAHRYHGIQSGELICGEWVFWRDGERCPLFHYKTRR